MNLNTCTLRNGSQFHVISQDAPGPYPIVLLADGKAHLLTAELNCPADSSYDLLQHDRRQTRFFNVYRAADGGFVFGSRAFKTDAARRETQDAQRALCGVSIQVRPGEVIALVGPSGSGKTTIIKLITGELSPTSGQITVNGFDMQGIKRRKLPKLRRTLGVIFQDFRLIDKMTVYENVAFAMRVVGASNKEIRRRVPQVLELVGLADREKRFPAELSGGEQQRVAIARALVNNPRMIIADEPTGNLDPVRSLELMLLLEKINELGTTVLVVTHEKELVDAFSKRVISIDAGRVISDGLDGYYGYEAE